MNIILENKVRFKLFLGCVITAELRMHLQQSLLWKQAKIGLHDQEDLIETHFNHKDYIGFYHPQDKVSFPNLKEIENHILEKLKSYCPHFPSEKIRILVFSQVFIS